MGWKKVNHHCQPPSTTTSRGVPFGVRPGSVWECPVDGCGKTLTLVDVVGMTLVWSEE
jgi:hypothetical protein